MILATFMGDDGHRYPGAWKYCECDRCSARLKISIGGKIEDPTEEEWSLHCDNGGTV